MVVPELPLLLHSRSSGGTQMATACSTEPSLSACCSSSFCRSSCPPYLASHALHPFPSCQPEGSEGSMTWAQQRSRAADDNCSYQQQQAASRKASRSTSTCSQAPTVPVFYYLLQLLTSMVLAAVSFRVSSAAADGTSRVLTGNAAASPIPSGTCRACPPAGLLNGPLPSLDQVNAPQHDGDEGMDIIRGRRVRGQGLEDCPSICLRCSCFCSHAVTGLHPSSVHELIQ